MTDQLVRVKSALADRYAVERELGSGGMAVVLVHLGRRDEALKIDRWLAQLDRPFLRGAHTRWHAAIAAALGDRERGTNLLRQAYEEAMVLGYHQRRDPEWRPLYGYGPYEEFTKPR